MATSNENDKHKMILGGIIILFGILFFYTRYLLAVAQKHIPIEKDI